MIFLHKLRIRVPIIILIIQIRILYHIRPGHGPDLYILPRDPVPCTINIYIKKVARKSGKRIKKDSVRADKERFDKN